MAAEHMDREACRAQMEDLEKSVGRELKELKSTLYGSERRGGVVADVNFLMNRSQLLNAVGTVIVGVLSSLITAFFIARVLG